MNEENSIVNLKSDKDNESRFAWIKIYQEILFPKLLEYKDNQPKLAQIISESLQESKLNFGKDKMLGEHGKVQEVDHINIDPFTIIRSLNASNLDKKSTIHNNFLKKMGCPEAEFKNSQDCVGLPKTENGKWFYPFRSEKIDKEKVKKRDSKQIQSLWNCFSKLIKNESINDDAGELLTFDQITIHKLSQALYCIKPISYLPLDQPFNSFLNEKGIIRFKNNTTEIKSFRKNKDFEDFDPLNFKHYLDILDEIKKDIPDRQFYDLYSEAVRSYKPSKSDKKNKGNTDMLNDSKNSLNQILYGPAGTGKTYHTINHALAILDDRPIEDKQEQRDRNKFKHYINEGRIQFVTFHQSYGYEEFVGSA